MSYANTNPAMDFSLLAEASTAALSTLPSLSEALRNGNAAVIDEVLREREDQLGAGTLSRAALAKLLRIAQELGIRDVAKRIVHHAPSFSAQDKQRLLGPGRWVQKTISIKAGDQLTLCTGVDAWRVTPALKKALAGHLGLSHHAAHDFTINPAGVDPARDLGLWPGMVSPFTCAPLPVNLRKIFMLAPPQAESDEFCISMSLCESLCLPVRCFVGIVRAFAAEAYRHVDVVQLGPERP